MNDIQSAEEFLTMHPSISHYYDPRTEQMVCYSSEVQKAMIEFAKLHATEALLAAKTRVIEEFDSDGEIASVIRSSYPLNNIR